MRTQGVGSAADDRSGVVAGIGAWTRSGFTGAGTSGPEQAEPPSSNSSPAILPHRLVHRPPLAIDTAGSVARGPQTAGTLLAVSAPDPDATEPGSDDEHAWAQRVRANEGVAQLSVLALTTGAALGAVMGLSNLYVGLKLGWSLGVVLTASIVGWGVWALLRQVGLLRRWPTVLEANAMASTASAAGYSTGTTLASAMAAHLMVTGHALPVWQLGLWVLSISTLGLVVAAGLRRTMLHREALAFPSGAAAAETLRGLWAEPGAAAQRVRVLVIALAVGVVVKATTTIMPLLVDAFGAPSWLSVPSVLPSTAMQAAIPLLATVATYGFGIELSVLLPAAGVLVGPRVATSVALGSLLCFAGLAPWLVATGAVPSPGFGGMAGWTVWPGATLMVAAGVLPLVRRWLCRHRRPQAPSPSLSPDTGIEPSGPQLEVPRSWLGLAGGTAAAACVLGLTLWFAVPLWVAALSVVFAVALAVVAARVTGETDVTPTGPLGKLAQLGGGVLMPGRVAPSLMAASVTAGAASSCADLLTDLKSGAVLGAAPRRQFLAQAVGVVVGVLVVVPVFDAVVAADPAALGSDRWPAPAAAIWASVSRVVAGGVQQLPPLALSAVAAAAGLAVALTAIEWARPQWARWLPSAAGLGLALVIPPPAALSLGLGAAVVAGLARRWPNAVSAWATVAAAGLIAGESLVGIVGAVLTAAGR